MPPKPGWSATACATCKPIDAAGGKSALVLTGKGKKTLAKHEQDLPEHTQVFDNLLAFSQYIMRENTQIEEAAQAIL